MSDTDLARGQEFRSSGAVGSLGIFQEQLGSQLAGSRLSQKRGIDRSHCEPIMDSEPT